MLSLSVKQLSWYGIEPHTLKKEANCRVGSGNPARTPGTLSTRVGTLFKKRYAKNEEKSVALDVCPSGWKTPVRWPPRFGSSRRAGVTRPPYFEGPETLDFIKQNWNYAMIIGKRMIHPAMVVISKDRLDVYWCAEAAAADVCSTSTIHPAGIFGGI
jgi:hypothetical protein